MDNKYIKTARQWEKIYEFLITCSQADTPEAFAKNILDQIGSLCSFDAISAYFLTSDGEVTGWMLRNIDERWIKLYTAYYMYTDNQRYSLNYAARAGEGNVAIKFHDWTTEVSSEFIPDFIRVRELTYSCGFGMFDINHKCRISIALDRKGKIDFSPEEREIIRLIYPALNNYHKNFYYMQKSSWNSKKHDTDAALTARESQIAALLCQSASPTEISRTLHIAQSTTYKHISNIYAKLNVSSQRELLALLLSNPYD